MHTAPTDWGQQSAPTPEPSRLPGGQRSAFIPSRVIATCFAFIAFAAATVVGVAVGNDAFTVLWRALVIMLACHIIGRGIGRIAQWTVDDHIERHARQNPIPDESTGVQSEQDTSPQPLPREAA